MQNRGATSTASLGSPSLASATVLRLACQMKRSIEATGEILIIYDAISDLRSELADEDDFSRLAAAVLSTLDFSRVESVDIENLDSNVPVDFLNHFLAVIPRLNLKVLRLYSISIASDWLSLYISGSQSLREVAIWFCTFPSPGASELFYAALANHEYLRDIAAGVSYQTTHSVATSIAALSRNRVMCNVDIGIGPSTNEADMAIILAAVADLLLSHKQLIKCSLQFYTQVPSLVGLNRAVCLNSTLDYLGISCINNLGIEALFGVDEVDNLTITAGCGFARNLPFVSIRDAQARQAVSASLGLIQLQLPYELKEDIMYYLLGEWFALDLNLMTRVLLNRKRLGLMVEESPAEFSAKNATRRMHLIDTGTNRVEQ